VVKYHVKGGGEPCVILGTVADTASVYWYPPGEEHEQKVKKGVRGRKQTALPVRMELTRCRSTHFLRIRIYDGSRAGTSHVRPDIR
jgi:hypothetical protein